MPSKLQKLGNFLLIGAHFGSSSLMSTTGCISSHGTMPPKYVNLASNDVAGRIVDEYKMCKIGNIIGQIVHEAMGQRPA